MGIRIKKVIGYGLDDVEKNDPRIDWEALHGRFDREDPLASFMQFMLDHDPELPESPTAADKLDYYRTETRLERRMIEEGVAKHGAMYFDPGYSSIIYNDEGGLDNVFLLKPVSMHDWYRSDDIIDYCEADNSEPSLKLLKGGIYPYSGLYMDIRTGERVKSEIMPWVRFKNALEASEHASRLPDLDGLDEYAQMGGFADHREALLFCHPFVPTEVRLLSEWSGIFTEPTTWRYLRPMVYTWWS